MHRLLFALGSLTLLLDPVPAFAQAGDFARMGFGARGVALGGALVADLSGAASPYYNPALAPFSERQHLEASAALLSQDRQLQFLELGSPLQPRAGVAAGLIHASVTNIDGRDNSGLHTGELRADEFAAFLAFGVRLTDRVSAGLGLQVFRTDLFEGLKPVVTLGLDAGLAARITDALTVGFAADDLLARYTYDTSPVYGEGGRSISDRFPTRLRAGATYTLGRTMLAAEAEARIEGRNGRTRSEGLLGGTPVEITENPSYAIRGSRVRVGAEHRLNEAFALRGGLDGVGQDGAIAGARPSAGFAVTRAAGPLVLRGEYGFALEPYGAGAMHLVTFRVLL